MRSALQAGVNRQLLWYVRQILLVWPVRQPVSFIAAIALWFHHPKEWIWVGALSVLIAFLNHSLCAYPHATSSIKQFIQPAQTNPQKYREITDERAISDILRDIETSTPHSLKFRMTKTRGGKRLARIFAIQDFDKHVAGGAKAYVNSLGSSVILVHEIDGVISTRNRFFLYHELKHAHWDAAHIIAYHRYWKPRVFCNTLLLCLVTNIWWHWTILPMYVTFALFESYTGNPVRVEAQADFFALTKLPDTSESQQFIQDLIRNERDYVKMSNTIASRYLHNSRLIWLKKFRGEPLRAPDIDPLVWLISWATTIVSWLISVLAIIIGIRAAAPSKYLFVGLFIILVLLFWHYIHQAYLWRKANEDFDRMVAEAFVTASS